MLAKDEGLSLIILNIIITLPIKLPPQLHIHVYKQGGEKMAVQSTLLKSALTMRYKEGVDLNGKDIIKSKKFSNLKVTASAQSVYDVAAAFGPLMKYPVLETLRTDDNLLTNA